MHVCVSPHCKEGDGGAHTDIVMTLENLLRENQNPYASEELKQTVELSSLSLAKESWYHRWEQMQTTGNQAINLSEVSLIPVQPALKHWDTLTSLLLNFVGLQISTMGEFLAQISYELWV